MDKRSLLFVLLLTLTLFFVHQWFSEPKAQNKTENVSGPTQKARESAQQEKDFAQQGAPLSGLNAAPGKEDFFVLENEYQQLVFSTVGGALSEINLPLKSPTHPDSVIREIDFDRILKKEYPQTDYFPSHVYYTADASGKTVQVKDRTLGGYYPLLRRTVAAAQIPARNYALNVVSSENTAFAELVYQPTAMGKDFIQFEATLAGKKIVKRYSFPQDAKAAPYCFDFSIKIEGDARDLYLTSGVPEVEMVSGSFSPILKYRLQNPQKIAIEQVDLPKNSTTLSNAYPDWVCNSNGFLGLIIDPLSEMGPGLTADRVPGESDPSRIVVIDAAYNLYPADKYPGYQFQLPLKGAKTVNFRIFAGPFASEILKKVDATYLDRQTGYMPSYISAISIHGWFSFISEPFAKFLFILMKFFYFISRSWGVSIILLTVALRIMLYPLNAWSIRSTSKMQEIAPRVTAIQEKHKKDPKRAQQEIVALYKEKGVNPFSGCLPILIQLPFLIGMFDLLKSTFELRGAPFIPYWINNLTAPDVAFSWSYPIPFIGTQLHLLPIIIGVVMYWQQQFSSPLPKDKTTWTDQQRQQRFMGNIMVLVFTVMFYHFPSGLNIYWLFSMLLGIGQQWYMNKKKAKITPA